MERIYNESFNITINAVYDSLKKLGIKDYDSKAKEGKVCFGENLLRLVQTKGKTKIESKNDNDFIRALFKEINVSLKESLWKR